MDFNNWKEVLKDGLPPHRPGWSNSKDVNICYADNVVSTGSFSYQLHKWSDYLYEDRDNVTHWQPLPPPPKNTTEGLT